MRNDVYASLLDLGFTEYEAKTYLALLQKSPQSGYAISLSSGVPRSKIYEVLGGLVSRGEVMLSPGSPALYSPLMPEQLIERRKKKMDATFSIAEKMLKQFSIQTDERENIWNINGREAILDRIRSVIRNATGRILLEIWSEDAVELEDPLRMAADNGVEIYIVSYGALAFDFAQVHEHDLSISITEEYGGRWVVLSADDKEIVAGIVSLGNDSRAAWTMHPGLVMPITEVIKHDLYVVEIMMRHRAILEESFGPDLIRLRNKYGYNPSGLSVASKLGLVKAEDST